MNVQPGNLARVVAPYVMPGRGAFVTVERFVPPGSHRVGRRIFISSDPAWLVNGWVRDNDGEPVGPELVIADHCLRRIDVDGDEVDEMVRGVSCERTRTGEVAHG